MKLYSGTQTDYDAGVISDNRSWAVSLLYLRNSVWNDVGEGAVVSFNLSDYVNDGSNITMGSVAGAKLTVTLKELSADTVSKLVYGTRMKIRLTLSNANAVLDSVTLVLDDKKFKQGRNGNYSGTVTLYDLSYLMAHIYSSTKETPTCYQVIQDISDKYDLGINASVAAAIIAIDGSLSARTYIPLADYTCKQTLGYMAGCYGCYAKINEDDEICFEWFSSSGDTIAHDRIFEGGERISEMESRVIAMVESGTQNAIVTAPDNASGYSINFENPYISQEQATAIYNAKIAGGAISFRVGKIKYKGSPLNSPGTIVTVEDLNGETTSFYIMKRTLRFDGGLSETIECQGESETTISYKLTSPTQQRINRALSRMEEAIKAATDAITQTKGSIFEFIPVDENDSSKGNAGYKLHYQDTNTSAFDDCVIMATAGGIGFSTDGGETFGAAAMYFYQDEAGEIHGCVNGEVIKAGSISADKINTDGLTVGTGNVEGLDEKLSELDDYIFDLEAGSSSLGETQQEIIDICLTEDMTQINGAHLATGSVLAASIAANAITAEHIAAGSITVDKLTVGDLTNYCRVNSVSYKAYGFLKIKESSITAWPTDIDDSWFTPETYSGKSYYLSDWVDFAYNKDGDDKFLLQGSFYNKRSSETVYLCVNVTLDDGSTWIFNQGTSSGDVYFSGSGVFTFNKTITLGREYGGHRVVKIRPMLYFSTAPTSTYWFAINDVTFRRASAGDITAGKLQSVDGYTYFDLDNSEIVAKNSSGYSTALISGGIKSYYNSTEIGGLQPLAITGITNGAEVLWFNTGLRIGKGEPTNNDHYLNFYSNKIESAKQMEFLAGSGGVKFYDTSANYCTLYVDGGVLKCSVNGTVKTVSLT